MFKSSIPNTFQEYANWWTICICSLLKCGDVSVFCVFLGGVFKGNELRLKKYRETLYDMFMFTRFNLNFFNELTNLFSLQIVQQNRLFQVESNLIGFQFDFILWNLDEIIRIYKRPH